MDNEILTVQGIIFPASGALTRRGYLFVNNNIIIFCLVGATHQ
jgi:hypothetical protein